MDATTAARDRVVVTAEVPIPNVGAGAPYHSVQELDTITSQAQAGYTQAMEDERNAWGSSACESAFSTNVANGNKPPNLDKLAARAPGRPPVLQDLYNDVKQASTHVASLSAKAADATKAADQSRQDAAAGKVDMKTVETLELARQAAVTAMDKGRVKLMEAEAAVADYGDLKMSGRNPIEWADLDSRALLRRKVGWGVGLPKLKPPDKFTVLTPAFREIHDDSGDFLRIQAIVHNGQSQEVALPDVIVSLLDERGLVLTTVAAHSEGRVKIGPNAYKPFQYDLRPPPKHVAGLVIDFGSGFEPPPEIPVNLLCPKDPPS